MDAIDEILIKVSSLLVKAAHDYGDIVILVFTQPRGDRFHGDRDGFLKGVSINSRGDSRESDTMDIVLFGQLHRVAIAVGQKLCVVGCPRVDRADCVNNVSCFKPISSSDFSFSRFASMESAAFL